MPVSKVINITNEEDKYEITVFVGVKPRIDTDIEFTFMFESSSGQHDKLRHEIVEAKAILLPRVLGNNEATDVDEMEEEEYEFDLLWDHNKQLWVATLK